MNVVLMELNQVRKGLRMLAAEAEDDRTRAQLESLLSRVDILDHAFALEMTKTTYHELKREHQELKSEHQRATGAEERATGAEREA
jgi:hypothetical protein